MQSRTGYAYPEEKNPERRDGVRFFPPGFLACMAAGAYLCEEKEGKSTE